MKKILLLSLISLFYFNLSGQRKKLNTESDFRKFEVGVNATHFLSNIFSLSNENESTRYAFTAKLLHSKILGTRFSIGGKYDQKGQEFGNSSFDISYNARLGIEYRKSVGSKFDLLFGLDVFGQYQQNKSTTFTNSGSISAGTKFSSLGTGPALRLEYAVTDRIILMTEAFLYGTTYKRERDENTIIKKETGYNFFLSEPTNLFISYKF